MSKSKSSSGLLAEMFSASLYKRAQGQQVRQVTGLAIAAVFIVAAWTMKINLLSGLDPNLQLIIPTVTGALGCWFAYRIVNYPRAADFLISVQGEMEKVSWPTWPQLWRATIVVLVVMVFLAVSLFAFDVIWQFVFTQVGFLKV
ncbi:preprotein translocase subunit SecE [Rubinisphaera italica]|uniref:Protein translocase subunit SecE n=1 Tax=Rubinisphaera italica TaxID=2527969 RepID=A0A5C5X9M0_9PLAN|nr:preprotein translocase subunit SecE [Rubinisphaera italica]TWT59399.1 preprotein translocase subunit SecE [Rubinisphaera italica]